MLFCLKKVNCLYFLTFFLHQLKHYPSDVENPTPLWVTQNSSQNIWWASYPFISAMHPLFQMRLRPRDMRFRNNLINSPKILSWDTAPWRPKNIQRGRELSTHTCMPALVPLWLRMTSPSWLTKKPRMSLLWRGVGTRHTAQNSFLSTRASGLYGRSLGRSMAGSQDVTP